MKNGWQRKKIGDFCEVIAGQSPEGKFYNSEGNGMPFYQGKKDFGEKYIESPTTWTTQTTKVARKGDILMSVRAPVGPVNFSVGEICIGRGLAAIRPKAELNQDFLFYQLLYLQPEIAGREGAVFPTINKSEIESLPISFVPLPEQHRIVRILDQAFDGIATAKSNAEKNILNARALFDRYQQYVFTQGGEGWTYAKLGELCEVIAGQSPEGKFYNSEGNGMPFYQGKKGFGEKFIGAPTAWTTQITKIGRKGDILMSVRAPVGPVNFSTEEICIGRGLAAIRSNNDLNCDFLFYQLLYLQPKIAGKEGAVFASINKSEIETLPILFAPLPEQQQVVADLDAFNHEIQHLKSIYQQKIAALSELKETLLHSAFNGEL